MGFDPSTDYSVTNAFIEKQGKDIDKLVIIADSAKGIQRMELFIAHTDGKIQKSGQEAVTAFVKRSNSTRPVTEAQDLIGLEISRYHWDTVELMAAPDWPEFNPIYIHAKRPNRQNPSVVEPESTSDGRYVYVISCMDSDKPLCKIGIANSPEKRLKQLSTSSPHQLRIESTMFSPQAVAVEASAHLYFAEHRRNGEWFAMPANDAVAFVHTAINGNAA